MGNDCWEWVANDFTDGTRINNHQATTHNQQPTTTSQPAGWCCSLGPPSHFDSTAATSAAVTKGLGLGMAPRRSASCYLWLLEIQRYWYLKATLESLSMTIAYPAGCLALNTSHPIKMSGFVVAYCLTIHGWSFLTSVVAWLPITIIIPRNNRSLTSWGFMCPYSLYPFYPKFVVLSFHLHTHQEKKCHFHHLNAQCLLWKWHVFVYVCVWYVNIVKVK